jgi:uncharacterized protein DUF4383
MDTRPEPPRATVHREPRTPAQLWCLLGGLTLLAVGIVGFAVNGSFDTGHHVQGDDLLVFEVNGWHNLVHIASGLLLLIGAGHRKRAKLVALAFGGAYLLVAVYGIVDGDEVFGLIPVDPADNVLHVVLALVSLLAGLVSRGRYDRDLALAARLGAHPPKQRPATD